MQNKKAAGRLEIVKEILEKASSENRYITSAEIARKLDISEDATHPETRKIIKRCAEKYKLPLVASGRGYMIISSPEALEKYAENLNKRIEGINLRKAMIERNFKNMIESGGNKA